MRTALLHEETVASSRPALLILFACVAFVLAIACVNLVNLVLARNAAREPEFAIRRAIGASGGCLIRQVVAESALLAFAGAAAGILLAGPGMAGLAHLAGDAVPRIDAVQIDAPALLFAVCLAIVSTLAIGTIPSLRIAVDADAPPQRVAGTATSTGTRRLHQGLCVAQVAMALMLVVGATLLTRSLIRLLHTDLGVSTDRVLTASITLGFGSRPSDAETLARIGRLLESVRALPGVRAAGVGTSLPPGTSRMRLMLRRRGDTIDYQAVAVPVTPGYFSALQMRLVKGRFFTEADDARQPPVMIVNEETARRFFAEDDPIGRTLDLPAFRDGKTVRVPTTLVGVVANVKYSGLAAPADDAVYRPFAQQPWMAPFLAVRTTGDARDFAPTLRKTIAASDSGIVTSAVVTLDELVARDAQQPTLRTALLVSLAGMALAMACVGLYGVVAYAVSQRTKEIGIRIALGATAGRVLRMVLADSMAIVVLGIGLGIAGALAMTHLLAGLLYGIAATDVLSFTLAALTLAGATFAASYLAARRAARVDPIVALQIRV